jgi:hypothetical protein
VLLLLLVLELLLEAIESLHSLSRVELECKQLLVSFVDVFDVFLVLDLELVEVDELEVVAHLLLVLDLILGLHDLRLQRLVLQRQLLNQRILRLLLVV